VLEKAPGYTSVEIDCQQIKKCIQIGLICVNPERTKRPTAAKVIKMLQGLESMDCDGGNEVTSSASQVWWLKGIAWYVVYLLSPTPPQHPHTALCFSVCTTTAVGFRPHDWSTQTILHGDQTNAVRTNQTALEQDYLQRELLLLVPTTTLRPANGLVSNWPKGLGLEMGAVWIGSMVREERHMQAGFPVNWIGSGSLFLVWYVLNLGIDHGTHTWTFLLPTYVIGDL
jgi:hypothetical protein